MVKLDNKFKLDPRSKITPVMQQWMYIKKQYPDCILFFQLGDFYELFFNDAKRMAPLLDLKLTTRGTDHKNKPIPLAGIPVRSLNEYLQKVISHNIPVAIVEQQDKPIKIKNKEFFQREVRRVITPGTILDPDLLAENLNNYMIIINRESREKKSTFNWGWILCDVSTGECSLANFSTSKELLNEASKLKPAEILINSDLEKDEEFVNHFKQIFPELKINYLDPYLFDLDNAISLLYSHFKVNSLEGFGITKEEFQAGIQSAGALIKVLEHRKIPFISSKLGVYADQNYMEIDPIAWKNLEIDQSLREGKTQGSLLSILDHTQTAMGARTLRAWLRRPLLDIEKINDRLDTVELFLKEFTIREDIQDLFRQMTDLERMTTKIFYRGVLPRDLKRLQESLSLIPQIKELLLSLSVPQPNKVMETFIHNIFPLPEVVELISSAINDSPNNLQDGGYIKKKYDFELDKLRDLKRNSAQYILELEQQEQKHLSLLAREKNLKEPKVKVAYTRGHGYYIELRNNVEPPSEYTIIRSLKDRTRYTTPELLELANNLLTAEEDIQNREKELFTNLVEKLQVFIQKIKQVSRYIAELDVLLTFAHLSNAYNYFRPELTNLVIHEIENGRHPIVEQIVNLGEFIPNDTKIDINSHRLLIISGANMGGKSTYLRQVALITILAQIGCFVPADRACIGLVDRIFTRVGIVDDIWKGQSHFMIEMIETANILNNATSKSLVLLDELGRGTSTNTGQAIAWAVSQYLHEHLKCRTLFATHYHQLNEMEKLFAGISNYHVSVLYDSVNNQLKFLRKVEPGGTDESYGLEVAELAGFPKTVINQARKARERINEEKKFSTSLPDPNKGKTVKQRKKTKSSILTYLVQNKSEIEEIILKTDIESLTPIDALNMLYELKKKLSN